MTKTDNQVDYVYEDHYEMRNGEIVHFASRRRKIVRGRTLAKYHVDHGDLPVWVEVCESREAAQAKIDAELRSFAKHQSAVVRERVKDWTFKII